MKVFLANRGRETDNVLTFTSSCFRDCLLFSLSALCGGYSGGGGGCWGVRSVPCRGSGIEDFAGIFSGRGMFHLGWLLGFSAGLWAAAVVLAWAVPGWSLGIVPCLRCFGIGVSSFPKILSFQLFGNSWTHSTSGDNNRASS